MVSSMRRKVGITGAEVEGEDQLHSVGTLQQGGAGEEVNVDFFTRMIVIMMVRGVVTEFLLKTRDVDWKGGGFLGT